jgi:hypothetical protein
MPEDAVCDATQTCPPQIQGGNQSERHHCRDVHGQPLGTRYEAVAMLLVDELILIVPVALLTLRHESRKHARTLVLQFRIEQDLLLVPPQRTLHSCFFDILFIYFNFVFFFCTDSSPCDSSHP